MLWDARYHHTRMGEVCRHYYKELSYHTSSFCNAVTTDYYFLLSFISSERDFQYLVKAEYNQ